MIVKSEISPRTSVVRPPHRPQIRNRVDHVAVCPKIPDNGQRLPAASLAQNVADLVRTILNEPGFAAKALRDVTTDMIGRQGLHAVPEKEAARIVHEVLHANPNSTRHLMSQIGWTSTKVKWGGADYTRTVWTEDGYSVGQGKLLGPDGF